MVGNLTFKIKLFLTVVMLALVSCKKDPKPAVDKEPIVSPTTGTRTQFTLDSIFLYAKDIYLWNDALPSYDAFSPRKFDASNSSENTKLESELYAITQIPVNLETGKPYEFYNLGYPKYSYIEEGDNFPGTQSSVDLEGNGDDFGIGYGVAGSNDIRIRYVNPGSPAGEKDIKRGYKILKVNGSSVGGNASAVDAGLSGQTLSLTLQRPDNSQFTVTLSSRNYIANPILKNGVFNFDGLNKKAGHLVLARFSNLDNAKAALDTAFKNFAQESVTDLIIDLRYNGGGFVETAEHLCNLIAPSSLNNKVMYIEHYNDKMRNGKATMLRHQVLFGSDGKPQNLDNGKTATYYNIDYTEAGNTYKFKKAGTLETVKNIYFIVSGNTASASELVINNLKPYFNVILIGKKTYGKPVGFFPVKIDKYDLYIPNFSSRNAQGQGDYYAGIVVNYDASDDVAHDFDSTDELALSKAIALIQGQTVSSAKTTSASASVSSENKSMKTDGKDGFKGMIETRYKLSNQ